MTAHTYQLKLWAVQDISFNYKACACAIELTSALRSDASVDVEEAMAPLDQLSSMLASSS